MILRHGRKVATLRLENDRAVARARRKVSDIMKEAGARPSMQTRFVTAVSEIARNAVVHGGGGRMDIFTFPGERKVGVRISDEGPGIEDLDRAMSDGFSAIGSMGRGLGGANRLAHQLEVRVTETGGTVVEMTGQMQLRG